MPDFLLEIGTEEIPARMLDGARTELERRLGDLLSRERLADDALKLHAFSTPRRLAVLAESVRDRQPDAEEVLQGPAVKVAFKDGAPTAAAQAFAKKAGVDLSALQRTTTPKGEYLSATVTKKGRDASAILAETLPREIAGIYWAKSMYWRAGKPERFVRPLRWMVALLDSETVPVEFGGVTAGNRTRGHRVLSGAELPIRRAFDYMQVMHEAKVLPDADARRTLITQQLRAAAESRGLRVRPDDDLLTQVVNLTEYPSVVLGTFEEEYLRLPEEVLVTVMRDHQKYFAVETPDRKLAPHFLAVLNTQAKDATADIIVAGNARVLRARFNDARFFWNTDQRLPLMDRGRLLESVTFQKD
ncbi:MAG: glycine--tRNA ligase subunit beta, partial [Acidobacteriales bacterium]|nr:glycine--tRNA ligase subunit beta [Terriglobales bacterium]